MKIRKLNNQGSTLLTIIIIIAFIGILGSLMLSLSMTNLQMKVLEKRSKENFYSCESTLDEIRMGLHELTVDEIRDIYENEILKNILTYIVMTDEDLNTELKNMVSLNLINKLGDASSITESELLSGEMVAAKNNQIFDRYLTPIPDHSGIQRDITIGGIGIVPQKGIEIRDIMVSMTVNGLASRIHTDIVVEIPAFVFDDGLQTIVYRVEQPYKDYALVADGRIVSDNSNGSNVVNGSVYGGAGITVSRNHSLEINGSNIITRENIAVADTARLKIDGISRLREDGSSDFLPAMIWANNMMTSSTTPFKESFTLPTAIDINGICLIKDDLTLNAGFSDVLLRGAYVGYTGTSTSLGSSIIVNGLESSLDLSGLDSLILAGRAYVSVDDNEAGASRATDIMTGESVAIKSNQKAYLIPGRFIKGFVSDISHNPVTSADIAGNNIPRVDFSEANDLDYLKYVDPLHPFQIASRQTIEGTRATVLYYYYLAFKSGKLADDYLREYLSLPGNETALDNTEPFRVKQVSLPDPDIKEVVASGNLMSYDADTTPKVTFLEGLSASSYAGPTADEDIFRYIGSLMLDNTVFSGSGLEATDTVGGLSSLYNRITRLLSLDSDRIYKEEDKAVLSMIISDSADYLYQWRSLNYDYEWFDFLECYNTDMVFNNSETSGKIITVDGDADINNDFTGLMVVNGNVTISDNVNIQGMILAIDSNIEDAVATGNINLGDNINITGKLMAMGDIVLGTDNTLTASEEVLEQIFIDQSEVLNYIFKNLEKSILYIRSNPADNLIDLSTMVYYRNWRRG